MTLRPRITDMKKQNDFIVDILMYVKENIDYDCKISYHNVYTISMLESNGVYNPIFNEYSKWVYENMNIVPCWSLYVKKEYPIMDLFYSHSIACPFGERPYLLICKICDDDILTDYLRWVDILYLTKDGSVEELESEKWKLNPEYMTKNIRENQPIQVLSKNISKGDIIKILKIDWTKFTFEEVIL